MRNTRIAVNGAGHARAGDYRHRGRTALRGLLCAAASLAVYGAAAAQQVEVAGSLDLTDSYARPGAYVPVRLKATNRSSRAVAEVRVDAGGPVETVVPWSLGPGGSGEAVVPVFYAGGELRLAIEFRDAAGRTVAQSSPPALAPRTLPQGAALISIGPDEPEPDAAWQENLRRTLGAESLVFVRQSVEAFALVRPCGLLDARVQPDAAGRKPAAVLLRPAGDAAAELVRPEVYRLFGSRLWSADERLRLWLWLALLVPAAGAAAFLLRRRAIAGAVVLIALGAAGAAALWFFGGLAAAKTTDARIFYVDPRRSDVAFEHLACLESRGGAVARLTIGEAEGAALPVPVLQAPEDIFRPLMTLHLGPQTHAASRAVRLVVRTAGVAAPPAGLPLEKGRAPNIAVVARRADYVAGLVVNGNRGSDALGHTRSLDAWAGRWQASDDADLAYAGRSLAWWDRHRRHTEEAVVILWWREGPAGPSDDPLRLPAMAVYPAGGGPADRCPGSVPGKAGAR